VVVLLYERSERVLLGRFSGTLAIADLARLDVMTREQIALAVPRGAIADFTAVDRIDLPTGVIAAAAERPPALDEGRVFVVPTPELFGLGRLFHTRQQSAGFTPPALVRDLAEAYRLLGLVEPRFEMVG
jgi:hypothetical protein